MEFLQNHKEFKPNQVIYNTYLQCSIDCREESEIYRVFDVMQEKDIVTYSIFVNYLFSQSSIEKIMEIFREIQD